jgi:hypothetical protein
MKLKSSDGPPPPPHPHPFIICGLRVMYVLHVLKTPLTKKKPRKNSQKRFFFSHAPGPPPSPPKVPVRGSYGILTTDTSDFARRI